MGLPFSFTNRGSSMLDRAIRFPDEPENSYQIAVKADRDWKTSKKRLLVIVQSVDGADLKNGELASTPSLPNAINYARGLAKARGTSSHFAVAVINHYNRKHLAMKGTGFQQAEAEFKERTLRLIKKFDPTHILFSGTLSKIYPTVENSDNKNGWVHLIDGRKVTSTLDFGRLMEKQGVYANLLGFWCRHLSNLLVGALPHDLKGLELKPRYVNTLGKFRKMMEQFDACSSVALDTETKNLTTRRNAIYTAQFCFDTQPNYGYVVPIDHPHPDNPFSEEDRAYIKKELRKRFAEETDRQFITFNGIFDMYVCRQELGVEFVPAKIWELMAGEHLLDENISSMASIGIKAGGLAAVLCSYGNDFYFSSDTKFSKAERNTTGTTSPSDPDFLKYAAMDVVGPMALRNAQMTMASLQSIGPHNYGEYFERHMLHIMSDTVHQLSHLRAGGSLIDLKYLKSLMAPDSILVKAISELNAEFRSFKEVRAANDKILEKSGFKAGSLFGAAKKAWAFSFNKGEHKDTLFFDVCKFEPVSQTKTGKNAVDKTFIDRYRDRSFLVAKFGEYQAATKLLSTYVKGWIRQLAKDMDSKLDNHLRASYKFFDVDTGRLASADPNLQNVPARGKLAKIIKEMFITADGCLQIRYDYSAHEVRGWSIVSGDQELAGVFRVGQELRQKLIKNPTDEIRKELKTKGDSHIQNVYRFWKKWVEKSDPLREAVKAVVFGLLYGKSAQTLGNDTKKAELDALKARINEAHKSGDKKAEAIAIKEFDKLLEEDRTEQAQTIIDMVFREFKVGHKWVLKMQKLATEKFYVYSPIGRIRHLYAAMTMDRAIVSRQVRRGMNAPIQGFASEIAVKASRCVMASYYGKRKTLMRILSIKSPPKIVFNRIVHDALYFTVPYSMVLPFVHILQYEATYGVTKAIEDAFGLKFTVEPEIELEIGYCDTASLKWDWELDSLIRIIHESVEGGIKKGLLTGNIDDIKREIYEPWINPESRKLLNTQFPLLNVDLEKELRATARKALNLK
jgi:DNA polymerase I-like protein with 3'-5' exonuclease and polymerase domains